MTQTIGIIGSGMIGSGVARLAIAAGWKVVICNSRGPETLSELVVDLGPEARATTLPGVAEAADLIVLAVPFVAYTRLPAELLAGKILIDTMNYYPQRDGEMREVRTAEAATTELVQHHLAGSRVIRALNNVDFVRLVSSARPRGAADRSALPMAGDEAAAKRAVAGFLDAIGYDVVDMGPLAESWRSEPTTPVYVVPYIGTISADVKNREEAHQWFWNTLGHTVTKDQVRMLLAQAERHDHMFGDLDQFRMKALFEPQRG